MGRERERDHVRVKSRMPLYSSHFSLPRLFPPIPLSVSLWMRVGAVHLMPIPWNGIYAGDPVFVFLRIHFASDEFFVMTMTEHFSKGNPQSMFSQHSVFVLENRLTIF